MLMQQFSKIAPPQAIKGFAWMLIGGQEVLLLSGCLCLSWIAPFVLQYALYASIFLALVGVLELLLVIIIFSRRTSPLTARFVISCRLLPSARGVIAMVAFIHCVIIVVILAALFSLSLVGVLRFPDYWFDSEGGLGFVSAVLVFLLPLSLKMFASRRDSRTLRWLLAIWMLQILCWLVGAGLDFFLRFSPPRMTFICAFAAFIILYAVSLYVWRGARQRETPLATVGLDTWPFELETALEKSICNDEEWQWGLVLGTSRQSGTPGALVYEVAALLVVVEQYATSAEERRFLRLLALLAETFRAYVVPGRVERGENHHAVRARRFAEQYLDDQSLLDMLELHEEVHECWRLWKKPAHREEVVRRVEQLISRLGDAMPGYLRFLCCEMAVGEQQPASLDWFQKMLRDRSVSMV